MRICRQCGKPFNCPDETEWGYIRDSRPLCSWHCLRAYDAARTKPRRVRKTDTLHDKLVQAITDGLTTAEIVKLLGVTSRKVTYCRKKLEEEERDERKAESASGGQRK